MYRMSKVIKLGKIIVFDIKKVNLVFESKQIHLNHGKLWDQDILNWINKREAETIFKWRSVN